MLILVLVGTLFSLLLTNLSEKSARMELQHSVEQIRIDLLEKRQHLDETGFRVSQDEDIRAVTNLVWKYQDPENYQASLFDQEKRKLVALLEGVVKNSGISLAAVYEAKGDLIGAYGITEQGGVGGYLSYTNKSEYLSDVRSGTDTEILRDIAAEFGLATHINAEQWESLIGLRHTQHGKVLFDTMRPIMFSSVKGASQIGWLRLSYRLGSKYVNTMARKLGSDVAFLVQDKSIASEGFVPAKSAVHGVVMPVVTLKEGPMEDAIWLPVEMGFEMHVALSMMGGEEVHLVVGEAKSDLGQSIKAFSESVFWVLLFGSIAVSAVGLFFARRWITQPTHELTRIAKSIASGEKKVHQINFTPEDELGELAESILVMSSSIAERENALRAKQSQLEGIIGNAPAVIYMKDHHGRYLLVNELFERLFSVTNDDVYGKIDEEIFSLPIARQLHANEEQVLETWLPLQCEEKMPLKGGVHTYFSVKFPIFDDNGQLASVCTIATDITERKRTEKDLLLAKRIIESANEAVVVTDMQGVIADVNAAFEKLTGFSRDEVIGKTPAINKSGYHDEKFYRAMWQQLHEQGNWSGEIWDRRKNGEVYPKWLSINKVHDEIEDNFHYVGIFSDISSKKQTEDQLEKLAYYDALTGLPNRLLFRSRLAQEIASAKRHAHQVALFFIDLDRFKNVNDTLGHAAGDELLKIVAKRLQDNVREEDTISRLGGDEFTIIVPEVKSPEQVSVMAQKIIDALNFPILLGEKEVHIGSSIGISLYPQDGQDIEQMTRNADLALYKAKDEGRNNFQFFSHDLQAAILERLEMETEIHSALKNKEFSLYFQPKFNLESGELSGMEALVRWHHPRRGVVSPQEFIPLAEETGQIVPLGEWILREACQQAEAWNRQHASKLKVAVNLSARQFQQRDLNEVVRRCLEESGLSASFLELELTESMVMSDVEVAINSMQSLCELGLTLAIDDFGTGYSSLSYLKRFPIHTLKIDRSFVRDLTEDSDDASIVQAVIALAQKLNLNVVAEGVETDEQYHFLRQHGCKEVQGYLLGHPVRADEFPRFLK